MHNIKCTVHFDNDYCDSSTITSYISSVQHSVKFLVTFHVIYIPYDLYKNYILYT